MNLRGPFRFHAEPHRYTVGGVQVPGTHAVLRAGGMEDLNWLDPEYLDRGRAVHAATLHYDLTGDVAVLPERWRPFLDAYLALLAAVPCRWRKMEHPRVHRALRFATMIDRVGTVNGRPAVVELKTGNPDTFHGPQLAGGDLLLPGGGADTPRRRLAFYLFKDGRFKVVEYRDANDYFVFLGALRRYWSTRDGITKDSDGSGWDY